ncbi:MAG: branched-chain amino acid ABC transporter permease [Actinomycetota bacterium]
MSRGGLPEVLSVTADTAAVGRRSTLPAKRSGLALIALAGILIAALGPLAIGNFYSFLFAQALSYGIVLLGLVVVVGLLGQPSLMHAELMGLGAGVTATLVQVYHWDFWAAGLAAVVVGYLTGMVVGLPALRIKGLALTLVTLAIARLFDQLVLPSKVLAGSVVGRTISRPNLGPLSLDSDRAYYEVALGVFILMVVLVLTIRRGKLGRIFRAVRESELGAAASGVSLTRYKLLGFATSAAIASLGGVVALGLTGSYSPAPYDWTRSLVLLAMLTIMGSASVTGAALAATVIIVVPHFLRGFSNIVDQATQLIAGGTLIIQTIVSPRGLVPTVGAQVREGMEKRRTRGKGLGPPGEPGSIEEPATWETEVTQPTEVVSGREKR